MLEASTCSRIGLPARTWVLHGGCGLSGLRTWGSGKFRLKYLPWAELLHSTPLRPQLNKSKSGHWLWQVQPGSQSKKDQDNSVCWLPRHVEDLTISGFWIRSVTWRKDKEIKRNKAREASIAFRAWGIEHAQIESYRNDGLRQRLALFHVMLAHFAGFYKGYMKILEEMEYQENPVLCLKRQSLRFRQREASYKELQYFLYLGLFTTVLGRTSHFRRRSWHLTHILSHWDPVRLETCNHAGPSLRGGNV